MKYIQNFDKKIFLDFINYMASYTNDFSMKEKGVQCVEKRRGDNIYYCIKRYGEEIAVFIFSDFECSIFIRGTDRMLFDTNFHWRRVVAEHLDGEEREEYINKSNALVYELITHSKNLTKRRIKDIIDEYRKEVAFLEGQLFPTTDSHNKNIIS